MPSTDQRLPSTFDECRAEFRAACERNDVAWSAEPIEATGPFGQSLTIDHAHIGAAHPTRSMVVLSGVHGVEGFAPSGAQCDLVDRIDQTALPADVGITVVHVVNPWGMAHDRRQNESNVDLNRNWARSRREVDHNEDYDLVHPVLEMDAASPPTLALALERLAPLVKQHGATWVERAITNGQYRHEDGLHFGGHRTERSAAVVEAVVLPRLSDVERLFVVDLHTGHGRYGELVTLCDQSADSTQAELLTSICDRVETATLDAEGRPQVKRGPFARGIASDVAERRSDLHAVVATVEVGTADDMAQLEATCRDLWLHRHGDLSIPEHRAIRTAYRHCFTPDDPEWERVAVDGLSRHLDALLDALLTR